MRLDNGNYGGQTWLTGISGSNVVGYYDDDDDTLHGFLFNGTNYMTLDEPNADTYYGTYPSGISGSNIVGWYEDFNEKVHGFLYSGGNYMTLDAPSSGGSGTYVEGICGNKMVGYFTDTNGEEHGFIAPLVYAPGCSLDVKASPAADGTVSGAGTFAQGTSQSVTASPNSGYLFADWTENGIVLALRPRTALHLRAM